MATLSAAQTDRAVGAVLASAAGDAMGAPYEFGPPNPSAPCTLEGGGGFRWEPGEWTDDTQMAVAVLSVLASGSTDTDEIGRRMVRWFKSGPADVCNQTRAVLGAAARRVKSVADEAEAFQRWNPDAAGNGALMRTGPVALAHLGDRDPVAGPAVAGDRAGDHDGDRRRGLRLAGGRARRPRPPRCRPPRRVAHADRRGPRP
jgi:ADP-ribosylglycohydrolase